MAKNVTVEMVEKRTAALKKAFNEYLEIVLDMDLKQSFSAAYTPLYNKIKSNTAKLEADAEAFQAAKAAKKAAKEIKKAAKSAVCLTAAAA